jgi:hypothetical protein
MDVPTAPPPTTRALTWVFIGDRSEGLVLPAPACREAPRPPDPIAMRKRHEGSGTPLPLVKNILAEGKRVDEHSRRGWEEMRRPQSTLRRKIDMTPQNSSAGNTSVCNTNTPISVIVAAKSASASDRNTAAASR